MNIATELYRHSLALLTDLYQLTMAHGYWKLGMEKQEAVFHLFYRKNPFGGGYAVACGLAYALDYIQSMQFAPTDLAYLASLEGNDGKPLFDSGFLDYLGTLKLRVDVDAVPEGTVVFPHEPLVRVSGPLIDCQLMETPLLNMINFQTLIATKAARICQATNGEPVLEFGLRRAQGIDGSLAATRAAFVGGCSATSNVLAGKLFGIPVKGTHAHSWVMCFDDELESFVAYAEAMPNNCIFLVDTYDTLDGVRNAVEVGRRLRQRGHEMVGVRLDSGDLAYLSLEARKILDEGGFPQAAIVASNDLDEKIIASLKRQGATISVWGVGTKLATGYDQPALGGVYKLSAIRTPPEPWQYRIKLSEQAIKINNPGIMQVRRYRQEEHYLFDVIYDQELGVREGGTLVDPMDMTRRRHIPPTTPGQDLLVPIFRRGVPVYQPVPLPAIQAYAKSQLAGFHAGIKRFENPHQYPVGLEEQLFERKTRLVLQARGMAE
ncbi:MAG: nicotinate phosphoribosyltransferase [Bradymonadales bacterium]|nr:nicotinate phosphoribosyltransferase [Bradymonadales bacterium]